MASSTGDKPRKKGSTPSGVRGPGGPPSAPRTSAAKSARPVPAPPSGYATGLRAKFEQASYPLLTRMHAMPRWLIVVLPAILLFVGLILTGPLAWVGGILLLVLWVFVAWLTALSWPVLSIGQRIFRTLVVLAMLGLVVLKLLGRF